MLRRINSRLQTKVYYNFNEMNEQQHYISVEGCQLIGDEKQAKVETGISVCVTERGNYIGFSFVDLFMGEAKNLAISAGIETKGAVMYKGKKLSENLREKIDGETYAVIKTKEGEAVFYPFVSEVFDIYIEYEKERNLISYVQVLKGNFRAKIRNNLKYGICFTDENNFVRENAEALLFAECSMETALCK